ncbi:uncharacterized protein J8A68_003521 [[Candida] subhashii]|uniref:Uncharacterized protein n=1 Tax=[Candida] subhashii TaxID=561895 RepID=A0A8J5ULU9_9ASCO|nr:uncharacterized protein J8A68_003521 [[Candida] subhashii]KAG7662971.1 hypothetical protein J8A68_003521 [[Candida] subhashii]
MIEFLKSSYNESMQEEIPKKVHDLFVDMPMSEDLENGYSDPADTNTPQSSIEVQEPVSTAVTDVTTTPTADTITTGAASAATSAAAASTAASATTITFTNILSSLQQITIQSCLPLMRNMKKKKRKMKLMLHKVSQNPLDLKILLAGTRPRQIAKD